MARRHPTQVIPPFPSNIDRTAFGHWLSGFVDGEGCFNLCLPKTIRSRLAIVFSIRLRADELPILRQIQSFWHCGTIRFDNYKNSINPICCLQINKVDDLVNIIIPHFENYPLRAKKQHDFNIWRKGVAIFHEIIKRPRTYRPRKLGYIFSGTYPKWTNSDLHNIKLLCDELKTQRLFVSPILDK